jgi:hypothetical protein
MKTALVYMTIAITYLLISCEKSDESNGVTFTRVLGDTYPNYKLDGNIVNYDEIIGYDSTKHIFLIADEAGDRIRKVNYPVTPTPFAIAVDDELIYIANFIPGYSSMSCDDCITVEPYSYDNKYRIELGYPGSDYYTGPDPRNDYRIISRLKNDKKLIEIE